VPGSSPEPTDEAPGDWARKRFTLDGSPSDGRNFCFGVLIILVRSLPEQMQQIRHSEKGPAEETAEMLMECHV